MRSALVISTNSDDIAKIRSAFAPDFRLSPAQDVSKALHILEHARFDIVLVDLTLVAAFMPEGTPEEALQAFKRIVPSIEIVPSVREDR